MPARHSAGVLILGMLLSLQGMANAQREEADASLPLQGARVIAGGPTGDVIVAVIEANLPGASQMRVGNTRGELLLATWVDYTSRKVWYLPGYDFRTAQHVVYAQFRGPSMTAIDIQVPVYVAAEGEPAMLPSFPLLQVPDRRSSRFLMVHRFDQWHERWATYQDAWGYGNVLLPMTHETRGGAHGGGFVWTDASRWTVDSPEEPDSVLVALTYWRWMSAPEWRSRRGFGDRVNLTGSTMRVSLRGRGLRLAGAATTFWLTCNGARWHLKQPLRVTDRRWTENTILLPADAASWSRSWTREAGSSFCLHEVDSYGLAFRDVPRDARLAGVLDVDEFSLERGLDAPEPR
jgi:hypothetical protein